MPIAQPQEDKWVEVATTSEAPPARSVNGFLGFDTPIKTAEGQELVALTFYGESESAPPELGHDGAGKVRRTYFT